MGQNWVVKSSEGHKSKFYGLKYIKLKPLVHIEWIEYNFLSLDGQNMELINQNGRISTIKGPMMAGKGDKNFLYSNKWNYAVSNLCVLIRLSFYTSNDHIH